jgi:hypothetical protein
MQILLRWLDRKQAFRNTASGNPKLALRLLHEILCLLKFVGDRVKGPLAIMVDVNLVAAHGFDYDAGLFHGRHYAPRFDRFPVRANPNYDPDFSGFNEAVSDQGRASDRHRQAVADLVHLSRQRWPRDRDHRPDACTRSPRI